MSRKAKLHRGNVGLTNLSPTDPQQEEILMNKSKQPEEAKVKYFGLVGHYNLTTPPDLSSIVETLDEIGLEVKFWKFGPTPHYLVRRRKAAQQGELRKWGKEMTDE